MAYQRCCLRCTTENAPPLNFLLDVYPTTIHLSHIQPHTKHGTPVAVMATDLEQLLDMGFEKARAEIAVKKSGGCMFLPIPVLLLDEHMKLTT